MARDAVTFFLEHNKCLTPETPMRSLSSPSVLHVAKPIRGGSTFSRASAAAAAAAAQQRGRIAESAAEDEEDDLPGSQATALTEVDGGGTAMDETDGANISVQMAPYANGNGFHAAVLDRLMAASRPAESSTVAASSASAADASQLLEADFTSSSRPLSTPTKPPQAKSARRKSSASAADGTIASSTALFDRYPAHEGAATSAAAAAAASTSAAPLSARVSGAARVAPGSTLSVPSSSPYRRDREGSSPCPTPQKRRNTALKNPATPAGKLAAQVAASRANTPATGSAAITPASQAGKRQKIAHGTPLIMQPLPPSSARSAAPLSALQPAAPDSASATNVTVASASAAPLTRASRSNSRINATDEASANDTTAAAAPLAKRTPSLTAKSLQY